MPRLIDWENVCLVCLQKGQNRFIFGEDNESNVIADKIMKCADILIKRDTNQPQNICLKCLDDLNIAYKFRQNCEQSDSIIKSLLNTNHREFEIKELWKTNSIMVNPVLDICIKDEVVDNVEGESNCDNESTPCPDLQPDPDTKTKFVIKDQGDVWGQSNAIGLNSMKANKSNTSKQEMNCGISNPPRGRRKTLSGESCAKSCLKSAYKKPLRVCIICNHNFRGQNALDNHMKRHNNERTFNCDHCDKAFVTAPELRRHVRVHTGQKPYKCQYCDHRFSDQSVRKNHERTHTGERPYVCPTCGKSFAYSKGLTKHLRIHTVIKKFVCEECGKGFARKVLFDKHIARHLTRDELDKSSEHKQENRIEKEIFQIEEFVDSNEINIKHEIVDTAVATGDDKNTTCLDLVNDPGSQAKLVLRHPGGTGTQENVMELNKVKATESKKHKQKTNCEFSNRSRGRPKTLSEDSSAKANRKSAYKKPLKVCEICNHNFRGQNALDNHMRRHNNERPFCCDHCNKAFVTSTELQRHVRVHTGQRPYKCQYCDRRFSIYSVRKNHERTHTGERPYVCPTCGKSFAYSNVLAEHLRIHTGVKKFMCKECGKGFTRKVLFERHVARHLIREELDKSSEHKQIKRLEKEIFRIEESADSSEINIKHEVKLIEEELN